MRHEARFNYMKIWNSKSSGNMYSDFEAKFEALLKVHFSPTIYFLRLRKLEVQRFKQCANQRWNKEVMVIWRQLHKVEWPFQSDLKFNLWIWNPIRNDPNFKFIHCHFDVSPPLPWELHLGHSISPKWTPHD